MKKIKTGSDFSGVGAFDQALKKLGIEQDKVFACDMDKYARMTYIHNYGEPKYYPENVYDREIPEEPLTIFMTSPPCQAFSLAGNRKGEAEDRGVLFYNSHEFIQKNKPRYFIFENVKGLLSDDNGRTFQRWCAFLGGKSVNGTLQAFPMEEAVPYHIYYKVLNAKDFGVPQNRERIFIIGIRDDEDNNFRFPKEEFLHKKLKDILDTEVDEKYFLSEKALESLTFEKKGEDVANTNKGGERGSVYSEDSKYMSCLSATDYKQPKQIQITLDCKYELTTCSNLRKDLYSVELCRSCDGESNYEHVDNFKSIGFDNTTIDDEEELDVIKVKSAIKSGYEVAREGDSVSLQQPNSETRRGRVGNGVAQTLDTGCAQGVVQDRIRKLTPRECFRLMDFPEDFDFSVVSDTQAYKQAGNSIVVAVLAKIINNLNLK